MRSATRLVVAAATVLALAGIAPSASASTPHTLTIVKDCTVTLTGKVGEYCTITESNVSAIPVGSKVFYWGPVVSSSVFLSSNITINDGHGSVATGYCQVDLHTFIGMCTVWKGTGKLAGFHALIHGSAESAPRYHWDGTYYFSGK